MAAINTDGVRVHRDVQAQLDKLKQYGAQVKISSTPRGGNTKQDLIDQVIAYRQYAVDANLISQFTPNPTQQILWNGVNTKVVVEPIEEKPKEKKVRLPKAWQIRNT